MNPYLSIALMVGANAALIWILAVAESHSDAVTIARGQKVRHDENFLFRSFCAMVLWVCIPGVMGLMTQGLPILLTSYGLFSHVFRTRLNALRGLPMHYVSGSNVYDRLFIQLTYLLSNKAGNGEYAVRANRAGRMASRLEITAIIVGCIAPFVIQYMTHAQVQH